MRALNRSREPPDYLSSQGVKSLPGVVHEDSGRGRVISVRPRRIALIDSSVLPLWWINNDSDIFSPLHSPLTSRLSSSLAPKNPQFSRGTRHRNNKRDEGLWCFFQKTLTDSSHRILTFSQIKMAGSVFLFSATSAVNLSNICHLSYHKHLALL